MSSAEVAFGHPPFPPWTPTAGEIADIAVKKASTAGSITLDWDGQPRDKGRYSFGKMRGKPPLKKRTKSGKISKAEAARVSSGILTDHPKLKPGEIRFYEYGKYQYQIEVKGPGEYTFLSRRKLK